ncbi:hypothetical protein EX895_000082 [Sporisorium graminicola]|uniref:SET domain-containing protein n=1 Tax=Sporisorium graminicola TaxID=280036 RepID=A0A4U7KYY0_9BASI|nr:hypothetical protein EX895_000082 [Sporisorium graminicola]TKY90084.1 hypothetical protein EX895_000082 [Sporisorium graminicola]
MTEPSNGSSSPRAFKRRRIQPNSDSFQRRSSTASSSFSNSSSSSSSSSSSDSLPTPSTSCSPAPTSPPQPARLKRFLSWCQSQGIHIEPALDLRYSGDAVSWCISIHALTSIPDDSVVATIPKTAILSRKTSALSSVLKGKWLSESHETVGLELALCLLYERCLGSQSRFEPFLAILPRLPVPLPFLRTAAAQDDSRWRWITATETDRIDHRASLSYQLSSSSAADLWPYDHDYGMCKQKALDYFYTTGIPILSRSKLFDRTQRQHLDALEHAFLTAYTHVSSRDFIIDTYHGVGLVPLADLFNHAEVHTVQFESDQDVCEFCGVAFLTGHEEEECRFGAETEGKEDKEEEEEEEESAEDEDDDDDDADREGAVEEDANEPTSNSSSVGEDEQDEEDESRLELDDTLDMRTLTSFSAGQEMYNTYGALSNALLLTRYGFCLDTETDFERFTLDPRVPAERHTFFQAFTSHPLTGFKRIADVAAAFDNVLSLISERFPRTFDDANGGDGEEEGEEDEVPKAVSVESTAIDALHQLDQLLPSKPEYLTSAFCPLFSPSPDLDEDLVDRDIIHPLFASSTGRTSVPLFLLTLLVHHYRTSSSLDLKPSHVQLSSKTVQTTLRTLHAFWTSRLDALYITSRVEQALQRLESSRVEYAEKACIHHAYQEHVALQAAVSTLDDLLTSSSSSSA